MHQDEGRNTIWSPMNFIGDQMPDGVSALILHMTAYIEAIEQM